MNIIDDFFGWLEGERNYSAPRLSEMCEKGITEPVGKTKCWYTGRTVTVYDLVERA